jgi:Zn-dependent peptidase ImmA (M78 family)
MHPRAGISVLVNYDEDLYRQLFSAAHEYAHVLFDREHVSHQGQIVSYKYSTSDLVELRANSFAAEFLLPVAALDRYPRPRDAQSTANLIRTVALDYRTNAETVAIALREANWITERTLSSFQKVRPVTIRQREKTDPDVPPDLTPAQTERRLLATERGVSSYYLDLLRRALVQDVISFGRFAEMLEMDVEQAREFVIAAGLAT